MARPARGRVPVSPGHVDAASRDPEEVLRFARHVNDLNRRSARKRPLAPVCGSDSTGRSPRLPGMGFIFADRLTGKLARRYVSRHVSLPPFISAMIRAGGSPVEDGVAECTGAASDQQGFFRKHPCIFSKKTVRAGGPS